MLPQPLKQVLSAYSEVYTPNRWGTPATGAGFSGARIFRLETDAGPFCLRGWPSGGLPKHRIAGLHRLLHHTFAKGVTQVAVPVEALDGETLTTQYNQLWQLEPWMPGAADFCQFPNAERLKNAMACLASFHRATQGYADAGAARAWFDCRDQAVSPAVMERLSYLHEWQAGKLQRLEHQLPTIALAELQHLGRELTVLFRRVADFVGQQLELLSRVPFSLQPCLRDIWHDHVLFSGDEVTGLIDASACRFENVATDLARLLGSLIADDQTAWETALTAYETHRPLSANERALVQALDQSGVLLSAMAWLDRLVLKNEQTAYLPKVLERLDSLRNRLQALERTIHGTLW